MAKKIIIEEKQFQKILERYYGKSLLTEMPYSPKDYSTDCAIHAIMVYIHLGKLFGNNIAVGTKLGDYVPVGSSPLLLDKYTLICKIFKFLQILLYCCYHH